MLSTRGALQDALSGELCKLGKEKIENTQSKQFIIIATFAHGNAQAQVWVTFSDAEPKALLVASDTCRTNAVKAVSCPRAPLRYPRYFH